MELHLREHQMKVINDLREGFKQGHRAQLLYAPTGFGKTEVAIYLMKATAEKFNKAAIVLDRIVLVDQTSDRMAKYNIPHGVYQAGHRKYSPNKLLQVCSAQTLERREWIPELDLLIVDECHITREQTSEFIKSNPDVRVIGLTATPFTKGLGSLYTNVVNGSTTDWLVKNKWLCPLKVYISKEIDMTGAKKVAGEYSADDATERGIKISGDIVEAWAQKTIELFGKPEKTIVFCSGVAHGADLVEQFARKGYNFVSISYMDNDDFKRQAIEDFAKPDTKIHGLIATDILTRGFDVPDVKIGVSARPFSKSFSSHVQQMGRVMRAHESKEFALWLDHSGNYLRFRGDWDEVYVYGVKTLDETKERARREPSEKDKKESKCPSCGHLWPRGVDTCPACGHVKLKRNQVEVVSGTLEELIAEKKVARDEKQTFYSELVYIARSRNYSHGWVSHKYKEKFGVWPRGMIEVAQPPSMKTSNWVMGKMIKWARRNNARREA